MIMVFNDNEIFIQQVINLPEFHFELFLHKYKNS